MSPDELELVIESSDSLGHFHLRYRLGRMSFGRGTDHDKMVIGGFEVISDFAQIVGDFADLLPAEQR